MVTLYPLSQDALLVLTQLALHAKDSFKAAALADATGLPEGLVQTALDELIRDHYVHGAHHGQAGYHITGKGTTYITQITRAANA